MMSEKNNLYSSCPRLRLEAARNLNTLPLIQKQVKAAPDGQWPYGMPTLINPLVLLIGPPPGGSPNPNQEPIDYTPCAGTPHDGLFYEDSAKFWERTRTLGALLIKGLDPTLNQEEALSLVGALNLSVTESADARGMSETRYAKWAIKIIREFQPRFVVLGGLNSELEGRSGIGSTFNYQEEPINWKKPERESQFQDTSFKTRGWFRKNTFFVFLPNHVGRPPMTALGALDAAALDILKLENSD